MKTTKKSSKSTAEPVKILDECIKEIDSSNSYWGDNRNKFRFNLDFVLGYQWESQGSAWQGRQRNTQLTFNKLYPYIKTILGEQLQNTPAPVLHAAARSVKQDEVNLTEGILRGIFYDNKMPQLTFKVFFNQLGGGYGAYYVHPDYESDRAFNQVIKIEQKDDPTLCYWDHDAKDDNKITGKFAGFYEPIPKKEFDKDHPDLKGDSGFSWDAVGRSRAFYTRPADYVVIANHWRREERTTTIYLLDDGSTCLKEDFQPMIDKMQKEYAQKVYLSSLKNQPVPPEPELPKVTKERSGKVSKIRYYKLLRNKIIEEKDWPGNLLPLPYVDGDGMMRRGRFEIKSFTDFAQDSQRAFNYTKNQIIQQIKNFRREQWIGTPENVQGKGINEMWRNPEEQVGILLAKRDEKGELPQKMPPSQISPDLINMQNFLDADIPNILGRHEAAQGQNANEISGKAILTRTLQDNLGSYIQVTNLCNGIVAVAEVVLDMIPAIYDSERDVITRDKKGEPILTTINEFTGLKIDDDGMYKPEEAYYKNQISRKKMRVELSSGPMFSAQKQAEFGKLIQFAELFPQEWLPALGDMIAENIDLPNTNQLVKRVRGMVPKPVLMQSGELTPEEQQQMQEAQQQQSQQPPPPEVQVQMAREQNDQKKLQLQEQDMQQRSQNNEMQNYLSGLKLQVEMQKIQNNSQSDQIDLQKDILKANTQLKAKAMDAMHKVHIAHISANAT